MWAVIGTVHKVDNEGLPRNCVYIIDKTGEIVARYDKINLYGSDLEFFSAGNELRTIIVGGIKIGFLICYDSCFPQLYEQYRQEGVTLLLHSFNNAGNDSEAADFNRLAFSQQITRAADNGFWIIVSNSSLKYSPLSSGFFGPDGTERSLPKNETGMIDEILPRENLGWTYFPKQHPPIQERP